MLKWWGRCRCEFLAMSRAKAAAAGVQITFDLGLAYHLPYGAGVSTA